MKIAVTYQNGSVFQHFGHTEQFKLYDITDGAVTQTSIVSTGESGHGALAGFLKAQKATTLICGGIGAGAKEALAEAGITLYGGVTGKADDAVQALLSGTLEFNPDVACSHHSGEHTCGSHSNCADHGKCSDHSPA